MKKAILLGAVALTALVLSLAAFKGFEYLVSDIATRIRYALRDGAIAMTVLRRDAYTVTLAPNGRPDGCGERGFRVVLSPYKGNKQVPAADIDVYCDPGRRHFWTGTDLIVPAEMSVHKNPHEAVTLTLSRSPAGITIVGLQ